MVPIILRNSQVVTEVEGGDKRRLTMPELYGNSPRV